MRREPAGDDVLVVRAARQVALRTAVLVGTAMLLLVGIVTLVVVRGQSRAADQELRSAVTTADDVGDPPAGAWLVLTRGTRTTSSPGLPADLAPALARARTHSTAQTRFDDLGGDDRHYRVATRTAKGRTVQVVLDLTAAQDARNRLLTAMGLASVLALAFAGGLGILLGRRAVAPLSEALALQRAFVADASHELRTPLTLLSTRAQLLDGSLAAAPVAEQVRADSRGIVDDVHRLEEVLDDLLVAADPGSQTPTELVDLAGLADAAAASAQAHGEQVGVALRRDDPPGGTCVVNGAPIALRRALLALIDNAIDHTPQGGHVTVTVRRERRDAVVTVSDTGPGIAPGAAAQVTRRFHSGGHRSGRAHYGLGLALTQEVASRHGGGLRVVPSSTGAVFELRLPLA